MLVPHLKAPCTNDAKYSFSELFYPNACAIHTFSLRRKLLQIMRKLQF